MGWNLEPGKTDGRWGVCERGKNSKEKVILMI